MSARILALVFAFVAVNAQTVSTLVPDVPQTGYVPKLEMVYYSIQITDLIKNYVSFTVNETSGECYLYVAANRQPTLSSYDYLNNKTGTVSKQILIINPSAAIYYAGVYGYSGCNFRIVAGTQGILNMTDEGIYSGTVATATFVYYQFNVPKNVYSLQVVVTRTSSSGDPDQYLAIGKVPTTSSFNYANTSQTVTSCIVISQPADGQYYYGVYGYSANSYDTQFIINNPVTNNACAILRTLSDLQGATILSAEQISVPVSEQEQEALEAPKAAVREAEARAMIEQAGMMLEANGRLSQKKGGMVISSRG